jgi:Nucleotidyl transferase AbiEii toxin, Type IV TA system
MSTPLTKPNLNRFTVEVLSKLGETNETEFVIGGGVALCHYVDPRETYDLDGWWRSHESPETLEKLQNILQEIAEREGLSLQSKRFGEVVSLALSNKERKKVYSVQIASRSIYLDSPENSPWNVPIETLRDNIGSKMKALITRGAPRDFIDIHKLCSEGKTNPEGCWEIAAPVYHGGNPGQSDPQTIILTGKSQVAANFRRIEKKYPLPKETPAEPQQMKNARALRKWYKEEFLRDIPEVAFRQIEPECPQSPEKPI